VASEAGHGPVLKLAYAVAEVAMVPVEQIAGYLVLVVNLEGDVGTVAAGIGVGEQMQACAAAIARLADSPIPDAIVTEGPV
jgi:hypothetical protein